MTRMSCDPFEAEMLRFAADHALLPPGSRVLVALSGGRDSMALLTALDAVAKDRDLTLFAAHYDHGLRGGESRRDRDFVLSWCAGRSIPLTIGQGDVASRARRDRRGVEETARSMRYAFLYETARQLDAQAVATAHNADDNVETILLHLVRGTGLDGLTGIPPARGILIRPLRSLTRSQIDDYLARKGVPWVEDSTNADPAYARNRIRQEVLPVLRTINPGLASTVAANLDHLRADRDYLYSLAAPALRQTERGPDRVTLPVQALTALPRPVAVRAVRSLLAELDRYQISAVHLDQILALAESRDPGGRLDLPRGLTAMRTYDRLTLTTSEQTEIPAGRLTVSGPGVYRTPAGWTVRLTEETSDGRQEPFLCHLIPPAYPLILRSRETGDRLTLPGRPGKSLKKWLIDEKIPRSLREGLPVLADRTGVLAAAGLGPQTGRTAGPGESSLRVEFAPPEL